jgi:hypothetical protein
MFKLDPLKGTAFSLVTAVACVLAGDALAGRPTTDRATGECELSERVAAVAERIRLSAPTLQRELPPTQRIAFRNF